MPGKVLQRLGGLAVACLLAAGAAGGEVATLRDAIDAAVLRGNFAALPELADELQSASGDWVPYYTAYLDYRQSQAPDAPKKLAKQRLNDCIKTLETLLERRPDMAEAYALLATCYGNSATYYLLRAAARGSSANDALETALRLDSANPRVLLQDAQSLVFRPAIFGGDKEKAMQRLQLAAEQFVNWPVNDPDAPVWGEAETWLFIGRLHQEAGDPDAARLAWQQALEIAPDYAAARTELAALDEVSR